MTVTKDKVTFKLHQADGEVRIALEDITNLHVYAQGTPRAHLTVCMDNRDEKADVAGTVKDFILKFHGWEPEARRKLDWKERISGRARF